MTITAVGYGDIVPKTTPERWYANWGMFMSGACGAPAGARFGRASLGAR